MTMNEIASWLHREYDIPYRQALSIAAKMIKEGAYAKPREEVEEIAKARAGVDDDISIDGDVDIDDILHPEGSSDTFDNHAAETLDKWFDAMGKQYQGEEGLLGLMGGAMMELHQIILENMTAEDAVSILRDHGFDDEYFEGLFAPSDEAWAYRNAEGKIKLYEWRADVSTMMSTLGIQASESLYYNATREFL